MIMSVLASIYRFFADVRDVVSEAHKMRAAAGRRYPGPMASE